MVLATAYTGTPIGVEGPAADVWRLFNFGVSLALVTFWALLIASVLRGEHRIPRYTAIGIAGSLVFVLRADVAQVERWHTPLVVEGAPTLTIALALMAWHAVAMKRSIDRYRDLR